MKYKKDPSFSFIAKGIFAPFTLLFSKNILVSFAPYDAKIWYLTFLKKFNKRLVYDTSWDRWNESYILKPRFYSKKLWHQFLKDMKAVTPTKKAKESLQPYAKDVIAVPHSIDVSVFAPVPKKPSTLKVLYVGRFVKEKGIEYLLRLAQDTSLKDVEFCFIGEGALKEMLSEQAKKLPIKVVDYILDKKELAKFYQQADIFILPSYKEGNWEEWFGISLIEAMACGIPVIATDCTGPKEIIDGKNGILVPQRDYDALKKAFLKLATNPSLRKRMGQYGRNTVLGRYDVKKNSEKLYEFMFQV